MTFEQMNIYYAIHNHLCDVALGKTRLNSSKLKQWAREVEPDTTEDQFIQDFADANDCGVCYSWNGIVEKLKGQFKRGERES